MQVCLWNTKAISNVESFPGSSSHGVQCSMVTWWSPDHRALQPLLSWLWQQGDRMEGDLLNCYCCGLLSKSPRARPYAQHVLSCYLAFLHVSVCTDFFVLCVVLTFWFHHVTLLALICCIKFGCCGIQQRFKMCNMGDRPVAIALTYQFMILQQVTELFVCVILYWPKF